MASLGPQSTEYLKAQQQFSSATGKLMSVLTSDSSGKTADRMIDVLESLGKGVLTPRQIKDTEAAITFLESKDSINKGPELQQLKDAFAVLTHPTNNPKLHLSEVQIEAQQQFVKAGKVIMYGLYDQHLDRAGNELGQVAKEVGLSAQLTPEMVKRTEKAIDLAGMDSKMKDRPELQELTSALRILYPQGEQLAATVSKQAVPTPAPKSGLNVDETRDEFLRNAQPVADALRQRGKVQEAAQLEAAAKVISVGVGTPPPQQSKFGEELKGETVATVLKNIWDVIDKDPELKKLPAAQILRKSGEKLDGAGLLDITVHNGVVVSFTRNFKENFANANAKTAEPGAPKLSTVKESVASAARAQVAATPAEKSAQAQTISPAVSEKPASLLTPTSHDAARKLAQERLNLQSQVLVSTPAAQAYTKEDLPTATLAKMGVPVEELERTGQLQKLLAGERTDLITSFALRDAAGESIPFAAKLVMQRDAAGGPSLQFDLPKQTLEIPQQILGREITPAMAEQLQKTGVVLADNLRDSQTGQTFTAYIAVDKELRKVVALRESMVSIPLLMHGKELQPQQQRDLLEGRPVRVEGMLHPANSGQRFDATMQFNPFIRKIEALDRKIYDAPAQQVKTTVKEEQQLASQPKVKM